MISNALAIGLPLLIGLGIRRNFLNVAKQTKVAQKVRQWAPMWNYKKGYLLGFAALVLIGIMDDFGEFMAARSPNELRGSILKRVPVTVYFLFGDRLLLKLFSLFGKSKQIPNVTTIQKAVALAPKDAKVQAAKRAAGLFWLSFLLNTGIVASTIVLNNWWTEKKLKADVAKLDFESSSRAGFTIPPVQHPFIFDAFSRQKMS